MLMQHRRPICFHYETFTSIVVNYPTYDKEFYELFHSVKKWKHYIMGKETIIHIDHQPLQCLHSQTKLQQSRNYRWIGFLQQFQLVIRYKKGIHNKVANMLSRPIINSPTIVKYNSIIQESYIEQYAQDTIFKDIYATLSHGKMLEELDYFIKDKLLYHLGKLCIPQNERVNIIQEVHTSLILGHFGVSKTIAQLQGFFYWPQMNETISRYIKGCTMSATRKQSNRKLGLYTPLLYVVVDRFSKMCILTPFNKQVTTKEIEKLFFQNIWAQFGLPTSIVSDHDSRFVEKFWSSRSELMDTKLNKNTTFHPCTYGQIEVVNKTVLQFLRGYCSKHPKLWVEKFCYV